MLTDKPWDQLELFGQVRKVPKPDAIEILHQTIARQLDGVSVKLVVHDNRSSMLSFRRSGDELRLRLHHMFLEAPGDVVSAIAAYTKKGRTADINLIDAFISARIGLVRPRQRPLRTRGRVHDLQAIFTEVNERCFQGTIQARIGWGSGKARRRQKTLRLGVYDHLTREIRIHPLLDTPVVPKVFMEYLVFHEMLHQLFSAPMGNGRRAHHPPEFRERERAFPAYEEAIAWEKNNLPLLLRRGRRGITKE